MPYQPKPVDTSSIDLGQFAGLSEYLAEQAHEVWAQQRQKEGWSWGPLRDDLNADGKAVSRQNAYLSASFACIACAATAVWLAIYQLAGFSLFDLPGYVLPAVEFVLVLWAGLLVLLDFQNKWRDSWLTHRS